MEHDEFLESSTLTHHLLLEELVLLRTSVTGYYISVWNGKGIEYVWPEYQVHVTETSYHLKQLLPRACSIIGIGSVCRLCAVDTVTTCCWAGNGEREWQLFANYFR